jgi:RNA polymerase sigma-70 factor (ECF subfamily)
MIFEAVYRAHLPMVWRTLSRFGVRESDLPDMTQDVFVVVHRQLPGFEARAEITTWLFSICRLVAWGYRRSARIRREVLVDVDELAQRWATADGLRKIADREESRLLQAILAKIREKQRLVFVMYELEEMSGEEIAALLQLPVGTVRSRLRLAREAFQREVLALRC